MKYLPLLILIPVAACAAPEVAEKAPVAIFKAVSGNWNKDANWSDKRIPTAEYYANIKNADPVVINTEIAPVTDISIGYPPKGATLKIEDGAKVTLLGAIRIPNWFKKDALGYFIMKGGEVETGTKEDFLAGLRVGTGGTYSGQGYATISGGVYRGSIRVGSSLPNTQTGTVSIVGGKATISGEGVPRHYLAVSAAGAVVFFPDETGITRLNYDKSRIILAAGARFIVDGSQYKGQGSKRFVLFSTPRYEDAGAVFETRSFPEGCLASVQLLKKGGGASLVLTVDGGK